LNPWLRQNYLNNKQRKQYQIKVLKPNYTGIDLDIDANNATLDTTGMRVSNAIKNVSEKELPPSPAVPSDAVKVTHKVKKGETLSGIAKEYNVSIENLKEWNNVADNELKKGEKLLIYASPKHEDAQ
jgi:LysM repeat protein